MGIDEAIIKNKEINPFPTAAITKRSTKIRIFIGRKEEMNDIGKIFNKISDEGGLTKMVIIEGESGVGKSTLFKRIYDYISNNDLKDLNLSNYKINIAWIEAPQDASNFTFKYIYSQAIQGFSSPPADLGGDVVKRIIKHLYDKQILYPFSPEEKNIINNLYSNFFNRNIDVVDFFHNDFDCNDLKNSHYFRFFNIITKQKRNITRYLKNNDINFKFFIKFIETVNPDEKKADFAKDDIEAELIHDSNFLNSEDDYRSIFKNITNIYRWIYDDKKSAIVLAIDSFELYHQEHFNQIFTFFLNIRNSDLKNLILFCIGTDQFWNDFNTFLEENKSGKIQFQDLIGLDMKLNHLTYNETIQIIQKYLEYYYHEIGQTLGDNPVYPFSSDAIKYLYNSSGGNIRAILIKIRTIWDEYVSKKQVPKIENYFQAMKNFRDSDDIELSPAEIEILYNHFNDISHFSTYGGRSTQVEQGVTDMLSLFKLEYSEIAEVYNKSHEIKVMGEGLRPDVYFILFGALGESEQRRIEIQVKMYESNNAVKLKEAKTSIKLLQNHKTDLLYFLTTSRLNEKLKDRLNQFGQRVGGINPLNKNQIAYLTLALPNYFKQIFKREILINDYKYIFLKVFTFPFEFFLEYLRLIPKNNTVSDLKISISEDEIKNLRKIYKEAVGNISHVSKDSVLIPQETSSSSIVEPIINPPKPISINNLEKHIKPLVKNSIENDIQEEELIPSLPDDKRDIIIHILIKMHNREQRFRDRATLSWLKKELANDFSQSEISITWKWLVKSDIVVLIKTSIKFNENSKKLLIKYNK